MREKLEGRKKDGRNQQRFARKGIGSKQGSKEQEIRRKLRKFTRLENKMERTKWTKY